MTARRTRREFLRDAAALGVGAALPLPDPRLFRRAVPSDDVLRVGIVVPAAGAYAEPASSAALGAALGVQEASRLAELLGRRVELVEARADRPETAGRETRRLVEDEGVFAVVGGFGEEACAALSETADASGALFLNVGCATDSFRRACRRLSFHVEASFAMYADAVAAWATGEDGPRRWHIVVSGAAEDHEATGERVVRALTARGGEPAGVTRAPAGVDPERLLRAAVDSGADLVFLCLPRPEREAFLTLYARQAPPPFEVAGAPGGTARLRAAPAESRAGVWPTLWHHKLFKYGAEQLDARFREGHGRPLDDRAWAGWMAVKAVAEAALRAGTSDPTELADRLERGAIEFDGHKGRRLTFRPWDHQLRQPLYLVRAEPGATDPWDFFTAVAEVPLGEPGGGVSSAEYLDRLGDTVADEPCAGGPEALRHTPGGWRNDA